MKSEFISRAEQRLSFITTKCGLVDQALDWDSGALNSLPCCATSLPGDLGQAISPHCASVFLSVKMGIMLLTSFVKRFEIY